ncbi:hypothetical protein X946_5560 [Burkholderia sp. ABCPW 111]|nr:hypothetical protein X946_5560 [Burkholderia sp. ABCPW 111]
MHHVWMPLRQLNKSVRRIWIEFNVLIHRHFSYQNNFLQFSRIH